MEVDGIEEMGDNEEEVEGTGEVVETLWLGMAPLEAVLGKLKLLQGRRFGKAVELPVQRSS